MKKPKKDLSRRKYSRKRLIEDVDFLFSEARAWTGNKDPEEMDSFEEACEDARDRLKEYVLVRWELLAACQAALPLAFEALQSGEDPDLYDRLTAAITKATVPS